MASQWYYRKADQEFGPVRSKELRALAKAQQLGPTDLVWKDGLTDWMPARKIKGLFASRKATVAATESVPAGSDSSVTIDTSPAPAGAVAAPGPPPGDSPRRAEAEANNSYQWSYNQGGEARGPVPFSELLALAQQEVIRHDTHVWRDGLEDWVLASEVAGLLPEVSAPVQQAVAPPLLPGATSAGSSRGKESQKKKGGWIAQNKLMIGLIGGIGGGLLVIGLLIFGVMTFMRGGESTDGKGSAKQNETQTKVADWSIGDVKIDGSFAGKLNSRSKTEVESLLEGLGFQKSSLSLTLSGSDVPLSTRKDYGEFAAIEIDTWQRSGAGWPNYLKFFWIRSPRLRATVVGGEDTPEKWTLLTVQNKNGQQYERGKPYHSSE